MRTWKRRAWFALAGIVVSLLVIDFAIAHMVYRDMPSRRFDPMEPAAGVGSLSAAREPCLPGPSSSR